MMTKIKLCGMRREEDIRAVNEIRPDYIGFICSSRFWRYIPMEKAAALKAMLDPGIKAVGVFVDEPAETIMEYLKNGVIDMVQLHGGESEEYIGGLRKAMREEDLEVPVIRAFRIKSGEDIARAKASSADYILLDSGQGSGETFDWTMIRDIGRDFFLAGGLNAGNVRKAIDQYHPFAVDISSGVETDRLKDPEKMRRTCEEVRRK
ncbi:MAG: phosphoribosylanthranilate isomerase [Eubacteriales bacterium]